MEPNFKIKPFVNPNGSTSFRVSGSIKGEQRRRNFRTQTQAFICKQNWEREFLSLPPIPMVATRLTDGQVADADRAFAELRPGATLIAAVRFYNENYFAPQKQITLADAFLLFMEAMNREDHLPATIRDLRKRVGFLKTLYPNKLVNELLREQIEAIICNPIFEKGDQDANRRAVVRFFKWAAEQGYCQAKLFSR